jgi:ATP-dependent protease HslVU (ClpYQ), ATPase subunit
LFDPGLAPTWGLTRALIPPKGVFMTDFSPREIVHELDRHIIGQD